MCSMKKEKINSFMRAIRFAMLVAMAFVWNMSSAQNTQSGYFTDGYLYKFETNPAIGNEQNFIAIPALGNINVGMNSTFGIDNVLYNVNGKTTTFLNPGVNAQQFLSGLDDENEFTTDNRIQLLAAGFKSWGGYNTIGVSVRTTVSTTLPKSIFQLAKEGPKNKVYEICDMAADADVFGEISLGHSRKINDHLRVGGNLKFLLGGANVEAQFEKAHLNLNENGYTAITNATINTSIKGFQYKMETKMRGPEGKQTPHTYVNDFDIDGAGLNGFGLGLDLGAVYTLNEDWEFSASLLDLGFISWNNNMQASTNGDRQFETSKYIFNVDDKAENSFEKEMDRLAEGLSTLYELQDNGNVGGRTTGLNATMNLAAEYSLPVYRQLSFGLMNTTRFGEYGWTDFRLSANWNAAKWFSASANLVAGTYGVDMGWLVNIHPNGFNFFMGMDRLTGKMAKPGVPISLNSQFNMGFNIPF